MKESTGLSDDFRSPPDSARPWVYWFWKNGNISRQGITADLEAMQRVGIGGVILMEVALSTPPGPVAFFSDPWRELFRHAVAEADRLGMQISMNSAPGWTGSGGPWIKPQQSMQQVVASEVQVSGPQQLDQTLAQPETLQGFYRDLAVLAFPTPAEDYRIADIREKALYERGPISSMPGVRPAFISVADYPQLSPAQQIARQRIINLTDRMTSAGRLVWEVPAGDWTIIRFGHTSTGQTNRPAPSPGLECDKLSRAALDAHFQQFTQRLLADVGPRAGRTLVATHLDSWEVGAQNWTSGFRQAFRQRRGYDLLPFLPVMTGRVVESLEVSERFLWDLRQTVSDMIVQNHGRHLAALSRQHGLWLSIEPYDMTPCDDMTLGATADIPMCEFWSGVFDTRYSVTEATSVGHVYGKPVVAAEAFTSIDRWLFHPASVKALGDWAFCEGVNRLVIHRYIHQPYPQIRPGLSLGPHGLHYERTQTWWELTRPWHRYLARCQYLLQQGRWVADLLYLSPEGAPNVFQSPQPGPEGYKFDACTPEALLERVRVENGRLMLPNGASYCLLVLPTADTMTPALLTKVKQLVEAGATIVGAPPQRSPSLSDHPRCDHQIRQLAESLWGAAVAPEQVTQRAAGKGQIIWSGELTSPAPDVHSRYPRSEIIAKLLQRMAVPPDFSAASQLRYAHRQIGTADVYLVSNGGAKSVQAVCTFRVAGKQPELWHPETGHIRPLPQYSVAKNRTVKVPLQFEPTESYFVVFRPQPAVSTTNEERSTNRRNFPQLTSRMPISGSWQVTFDRRWGGPDKPTTFEQLVDWTSRDEQGIKYYSGSATYAKTIELPAEVLGAGRRLWLDLGQVQVMAKVTLNGKLQGVLWKPPYRTEVTGTVRRGANRLKIEVVNLWPNRMIGDEHLPPDSDRQPNGVLRHWPQWLTEGKSSPTDRYTFSSWRHWTADSPLLPSGLLGPVSLQGEASAE